MAVTYSGRTPFLETVDKLTLSSLGLALRALFRYTTNLIASFHFHCGYFVANTPSLLFSCFISDTMEFTEFVEEMRPLFNILDLTTAIDCIMEHSDKGVLQNGNVDRLFKLSNDPSITFAKKNMDLLA